MATVFSRYMEQAATYWAAGASDGFGGYTFSAPVPVLCRWQEVAIQFRNAQGQEVTSDAVVYVDQQLEVGGYIALGTHVDATPVATAKEIRRRESSPSLSADEELHKVIL